MPTQEVVTQSATPTASVMNPDMLQRLATTHIVFGHQSVGRNILQGLTELGVTSPGGPLSIVSSRRPDDLQAAHIMEFAVGENGQPQSKQRDFAAALDSVSTSTAVIAVMKYCYLDVTAETTVDEVFNTHREMVRGLRQRHPNMTFVHVTMPLTTVESGGKLFAKRLMRRPTARDANAKRGRFNSLIRSTFADEPVFDLARIESTKPDGSRSYFLAGADTVETLAEEYTDDGGHLNDTGRALAAAEFLKVLADAAARQQR
jgi:lysophospholipase L1-like esterase